MKKIVKLSVVMSVYNGSDFIKSSIECILNQTYKDFEFIIINDGSTDNSSDIIESYAKIDERIIVVNQVNIGLTKSLNKAIAVAKGVYIARQDVDDISDKYRFEKQIKILDQNKNINIVSCWYNVIDESNCKIAYRKPSIDIIKLIKTLKKENIICHSSVMFRKSDFYNVGKYDETRRYAQDYDLWKRLNKFYIIPEFLVDYRFHYKNIGHYKNKNKTKNYDSYYENQRIKYLTSILLKENEIKKSRDILKKNLFTFRNFSLFILTYLPNNYISLILKVTKS